ncbi:MAG: tyrosine--tRNA ligase [Clostridiales bacterium]|jgi:tyrosyl-tRNA synthetase|nr:tyrosine--tRNA ligase [Clostridiales bacterium]
MNVFNILKERDLISQVTHENEIKKILEEKKISFYTGFDVTADSLHVGHMMQLIIMKHMQNAGHKPIILLGGATTMIGDPTGKTDMRPMREREEIEENAKKFKIQMENFIDFSDNKALIVNNADWLLDLNYIEFLRKIGIHFSVNKMLTSECFKSRLINGLSFFEFNYMLMQGYDFYHLNKEYNCVMQFGGNDQWSNILAGSELIKRKTGKQAYGMTFNLLTTNNGKKMGKTEKGALWLDPKKINPYEFFQYWRNISDSDVIKMLKMITFLPIEEINIYENKKGKKINEAKIILAYEVTKLVHGENEAIKARERANSLFNEQDFDNIPCYELSLTDKNISIINLLVTTNLASSKNEAKRLIEQGGITINGENISDINLTIEPKIFKENELIIKKGKKIFLKIINTLN